jgi:3-hydroxybutyryl-CoA dehydrogenase
VSIPAVVGVLGAGTMGSGIAQLAAQAGARTLVHDPDGAALERGLERARAGIARAVERGRLAPEAGEAAAARLQAAPSPAALAPCRLVIEAAPERLEVKRALFAHASEVVDEACVLATNTSSLPVTAIASAARRPERVVGMHFFNPAPVMPLLEVVAGEQSAEAAIATARAAGEAMGKQVILAADGPGFLVNRCNRPFGLEALRLVQERLATPAEIDRCCRLGGGFRMGPFELMDLVGIDVGLEVARSFAELSFGEPRWRPSPLAARMVAAGRLGRKSGRGWYEYEPGRPHRPDDPPPPAAGGGGGRRVTIAGELALARELREAARAAGWDAGPPAEAAGEPAFLAVDCDPSADGGALPAGPRAVLCAAGSLAALDRSGDAVGFHALPPLAETGLVELCRHESSSPAAAEAAEAFFSSLGRALAWVGDAPGLVLGRIVAQVVNECAFALGEGVGSAADIDRGMRLGMSWPRGPLAWADAAGLDHVLGVLEGLWHEYREERYRPAPELRRRALAGGRGGPAATRLRG